MKCIAIIVLAIGLGCAWGLFMDWLWPYTWLKLVPEVLGAAGISLNLVLGTKDWWLGGLK